MKNWIKNNGVQSALYLLYVLTFFFGWWCSTKHSQRAAVEASHAHYYIGENYKREWRWNVPCGGDE